MLLERTRRSLLRKELREARLRAELRQVDVAKILKKPQSYVAKVESGERRMDFIEVLNFCKAVNLDPGKLIDRLT